MEYLQNDRLISFNLQNTLTQCHLNILESKYIICHLEHGNMGWKWYEIISTFRRKYHFSFEIHKFQWVHARHFEWICHILHSNRRRRTRNNFIYLHCNLLLSIFIFILFRFIWFYSVPCAMSNAHFITNLLWTFKMHLVQANCHKWNENGHISIVSCVYLRFDQFMQCWNFVWVKVLKWTRTVQVRVNRIPCTPYSCCTSNIRHSTSEFVFVCVEYKFNYHFEKCSNFKYALSAK